MSFTEVLKCNFKTEKMHKRQVCTALREKNDK